MEAALSEIDRDALWQKIQAGDDFVLVDSLSPMSYALSHLPGAVNLPRTWVKERAAWRIPDFDREVVVYCESVDCDNAATVANLLLALGYRNVRHYAGGKRDWVDAGLPIEGGGTRSRARS